MGTLHRWSEGAKGGSDKYWVTCLRSRILLLRNHHRWCRGHLLLFAAVPVGTTWNRNQRSFPSSSPSILLLFPQIEPNRKTIDRGVWNMWLADFQSKCHFYHCPCGYWDTSAAVHMAELEHEFRQCIQPSPLAPLWIVSRGRIFLLVDEHLKWVFLVSFAYLPLTFPLVSLEHLSSGHHWFCSQPMGMFQLQFLLDFPLAFNP